MCYRLRGGTLLSTDFDLEPNMFVEFSFATFVSTLTKLTAATTSSHLVWMLIFGLNVTLAIGSIAFMMGHGVPREPFAGMGTSTYKTPPSWGPEKAHAYPYSQYVKDVMLWSLATDMELFKQGPAVAMQMTGAAKNRVTQIVEGEDGLLLLQRGNGQMTGLMYLLQNIGEKFAPLEVELSARAMNDMMSFHRQHGESIDALLSRFEMVRTRAMTRGGMGMTHEGLTWILMKAVGLNPDQWDRCLDQLQGRMPNNDYEFNLVCERLRRYGHLHEPNSFMRRGAPNDYFAEGGTDQPPAVGGSSFYFPLFDGTGPQQPQTPQPPPAAPANSFMSNAQFLASGAVGSGGVFNTAGSDEQVTPFPDEQCQACGSFMDEEFSSATETDNENETLPLAASYQTLAVGAGDANNDNDVQCAIFQDYLAYKRLWRRVSQRPPRRYRKFNKVRKRHFNKFKSHGRYAAFLPQNAFAGHRGPGGAKKFSAFKRKTNPRGKDGKPLACHKCGSTEHLQRDCPQNQTGLTHFAGTANSGGAASSSSGLNLYTEQQPQNQLQTMSFMASSGGAMRPSAIASQPSCEAMHEALGRPTSETTSQLAQYALPGVNFTAFTKQTAIPSRTASEVGSVNSSVSRPGISQLVQPNQWTNWMQAMRAQASVPSPSVGTAQEMANVAFHASPKQSLQSETEMRPVPPPPPAPPAAALANGSAAADGNEVAVGTLVHRTSGDDTMPDAWAAAAAVVRQEAVSTASSFAAGVTVHSDTSWNDYRPGAGTMAMSVSQMKNELGSGRNDTREDRRQAEAEMLGRQSCSFLNFGAQRPPPPPSGVAPFVPQMPVMPVMQAPMRAPMHVPQLQAPPQQPMVAFPNGGLNPNAEEYRCPHQNQGEDASRSYPWWEATTRQMQSLTYHLKTRINGVVGLLVDPGAHDNLVGDRTIKAMSEQSGKKIQYKKLLTPMAVEGVGKGGQTADQAGCVPIGLEGSEGTFTAPIIPDSDLPPLLGMRTLEGRKAILDCGNRRLILPGPGGVHLHLSPGSLVFELEKSPSGHLILPTTNFPVEGVTGSAEDDRLAFVSARPVASSAPSQPN